MTTFYAAYVIAEFATMAGVFAYLILYVYLIRYLRQNYSEIWRGLGEPDFTPQDDRLEFAQSHLNVMRFVFSNQSASLQDRGLTALVQGIRISLCAATLSAGLLFSLSQQMRS